jgi:hypothetical protein
MQHIIVFYMTAWASLTINGLLWLTIERFRGCVVSSVPWGARFGDGGDRCVPGLATQGKDGGAEFCGSDE